MNRTPFWLPYSRRVFMRIQGMLAPYTSYGKMGILLLGVAVFLLVQGGLSWMVQSNRPTPYPLDEALYYLSQASRIPECLTPCPALEDIRTQTDGATAVYEASYQRWAVRYHELVFQNPLPALIMALFHNAGLSWWATYNLLIVFGRILQVVALTYLLNMVWGRVATAIALVLTAFTVFPSYGLHHVVPSNIAQMIALLIWGRILLKGREAWGALLWGTLILLVTHPQGRLLAGVAWALYVLPGAWPTQKREWQAIGGSLAAIVLYSGLGAVLRWPEISYFGTFNLPDGMSAQEALIENVRVSMSYVTQWYLEFPFQIIGALVVVVFALLTLEAEQRRRALWLLLLVTGLSAVLMLHTIPDCCWAESFRRQFMLFQILIFGAVGQALWVSGRYCLERGLPMLFSSHPSRTSSLRLWTLLGALVVAYLAGRYAAFHVVNGYDDLQAEYKIMSERQNFDLREETVQRLLDEADSGDRVLYMDLVVRQYALMNGARSLGAVFYPAIEASEVEAEWLNDPNLRYLVDNNPIETFDREMIQLGALQLAELPYLRYESMDEVSLKALQLWISNPGEAFELQFLSGEEAYDPVMIPAGFEGWLLIGEQLPDERVTAFEMRPVNPPEDAEMKGLRFAETSFFWPWEWRGQLTTFSYRQNQEVTASFDPADIFPGNLSETGQRQVEILIDEGYLVLARLAPMEAVERVP